MGPVETSPRIVVMGVAGSGKTTVGSALAQQLGAAFVDADSLHTEAHVAQMARGQPLTDDDRWPWLVRVRGELRRTGGVVVACSALARRHRDVLRGAAGVRFVFLDLDPDTARRRLEGRTGHYMGARMLASQFAALEPPTYDELDVVRLDATQRADELVEAIAERFRGD